MNTAHTFSRRWLRRPLKVVFAVVAIATLAACENLPLYNKEKDELAKSAQKAYTDTKVTEALNVQERNLEKLLKAEIDALNESASLRLDIALLRMSDDRPTKSGSTSLAGWYVRAKQEEKILGFPDQGQVLAMLDHQIEVATAKEQIETFRVRIRTLDAAAIRALPSCAKVKNADLENLKWKYAEGIADKDTRAALILMYRPYVAQCKKALKPRPSIAGRVGAAFDEWAKAETALSKRKQRARTLAAKVTEIAKALKTKREEARKNLSKFDDLEKKTKKVVSETKSIGDAILAAVKELGDVAGGEGGVLVAEQNIAAIITVLAALGSDHANADGLKDAQLNLNTAVNWIKDNVPSLAADMAALLDQATAPPVSNLILELQHQTIEQNYAKALVALSEKRIEMLRARYRTLVDTAGAWRDFRLALCNFAVLSSDRTHPGEKCEKFDAKPVSRDKATCTLDNETIEACALKLTWREALDAMNTISEGRQKRAFYRALYQYAEAFEAERVSREAEFRLADLDHREALAAQRSGIEAWNNLVAVPIGQLAAYHASGIKPEAIANAISTALGLAAIGAGVAQ